MFSVFTTQHRSAFLYSQTHTIGLGIRYTRVLEMRVWRACVHAHARTSAVATPISCVQASMTTTSGNLLGIDIGTSNVKAVLVRKSDLQVLAESSRSLGPHVTLPQQNAYERDVQEIFKCLDECMDSLEPSMLQNVVGVGVCGQMHGCVLWKSKIKDVGGFVKLPLPQCSTLITWQDGRCTPEFLSTLPPTHQPIRPSTGYGCATLAWLSRFQLELLEQFDRAGTIMDLVVWWLCGHGQLEEGGEVVMSTQNATSWGYFDISELKWERDM